MPAVAGPLGKAEAAQIAGWLRERVTRRVSLDVWTRPESGLVLPDRDPCTHCDDVSAAMRQLASLHPALQYTAYDLNRHADRAAEAHVDLAPTTIVRGSGRAVYCTGYFSGYLFPALLDVIWFVSEGAAPLTPQTCEALAPLTEPVEMEAMVVPYDGYSTQLVRLAGALAAQSKQIHLRLVEASEFPRLASRRALTQAPLLTINGRRFTGAWDEAPLVEQIRRVVAGNDDPVIRDRLHVSPYYTEDQMQQLAEDELRRTGAPAAPMPTDPGALDRPGSA